MVAKNVKQQQFVNGLQIKCGVIGNDTTCVKLVGVLPRLPTLGEECEFHISLSSQPQPHSNSKIMDLELCYRLFGLGIHATCGS